MTQPHVGTLTPGTSSAWNNLVDAVNSSYGAVQYSQPASQTIASASTFTTMTGWSVEIANTLGGSIASGTYTIASAATLAISASVSILNGATDYRFAAYVNGSSVRESRIALASAASASAHSLALPTFDWAFSAGDTINLRLFIGTAGLSTTASAADTWWRMRRVA